MTHTRFDRCLQSPNSFSSEEAYVPMDPIYTADAIFQKAKKCSQICVDRFLESWRIKLLVKFVLILFSTSANWLVMTWEQSNVLLFGCLSVVLFLMLTSFGNRQQLQFKCWFFHGCVRQIDSDSGKKSENPQIARGKCQAMCCPSFGRQFVAVVRPVIRFVYAKIGDIVKKCCGGCVVRDRDQFVPLSWFDSELKKYCL